MAFAITLYRPFYGGPLDRVNVNHTEVHKSVRFSPNRSSKHSEKKFSRFFDAHASATPAPGPSSHSHSKRVWNGKHAIVVGAGIGGIFSAALLAKEGFSVTVYEKNPGPGGRLGRMVDPSGCRHDVGPSLLLMPHIYREAYEALDEKLEDHLQLRRVDPAYQVFFGDGTSLKLFSDLGRMKDELEGVEGGSFEGYLRYLADAAYNFREGMKHFIRKDFNSITDYLSDPAQKVPLAFKLKPFKSHHDELGNFFKDPRLKAAFSFQNMYLGLSPYDASSIFSLLQYTELVEGVWYPIGGGMYKVTESFVNIADKLGVKFRYNSSVTNIERASSGDRATGVQLADGGRASADVVVINADLPYAYSDLLQDEKKAAEVNALRHTSGVISFYWSVKEDVAASLNQHNIFLSKDGRTSWRAVFGEPNSNRPPTELDLNDPNFYVHVPARTDPSSAFMDAEPMMVLIPVPHIADEGTPDYESQISTAREAVITRLESSGLADIRSSIEHETVYTPRTWKSLYNLNKGSAFGLSHPLWQLGFFRPQNKHPVLQNVYFVGASTHPGNGIPLVLLSARFVHERVVKEIVAAPA
mmetsp:Transcript_2580/g.3970  ORF Transcript_2580/g.3970 Transcript_2580/m.3970 type:complete len:583 (+) Transcript_2580:47-1795(+)